MPHSNRKYYLAGPSHWPIVGSLALFFTFLGAALWLHENPLGPYVVILGLGILCIMLFGWFGAIIEEGRKGLLRSPETDRAFRIGMMWFIFTEVMFFACFFAALFYARFYAVPFLGGAGKGAMTQVHLWPAFKASWPLLKSPDPSQFSSPKGIIATWGIPAFNTLVLLLSGVTLTIAHWGIVKNKRAQMIFFQAITIILGIIFLMLQVHEYWTAYAIKSLRIESGIYGATFFMLTGFHALHVTVGIIALTVILWRLAKDDFTTKNHFAFEGVAWYWHFVDVVWLGLFVVVYWL